MRAGNCFLVAILLVLNSHLVNAESMRCKGDIIEEGDIKAEVLELCGPPQMTDSYCEKSLHEIPQPNGKLRVVETCENIDIWTYNPGVGQFWTNLYFAQGKLREMHYGDRIK